MEVLKALRHCLNRSTNKFEGTSNTPLFDTSSYDAEDLRYTHDTESEDWREPLLSSLPIHYGSDSSKELAEAPFIQPKLSKANPGTPQVSVQVPSHHEETNIPQNLHNVTVVNRLISNVTAEDSAQKSDQHERNLPSVEYSIKDSTPVSDQNKLLSYARLETSSEIQENRQHEHLSQSSVPSEVSFTKTFRLVLHTSRYAHSMDTQHGDLSVDHVRCDVVQPFTPEKDKPRLVVSKYEHDRVFKYFECVENVSSVPFIDEVTILEFDSSGKEYTNISHGITLKIPENTISQGSVVHFEVAVALYGPFQFPEDRRPISPILWICPQEDIVLQKPIEIILPHVLNNGLTNEDISRYDLKFYKANHTDHIIKPNRHHQYVFRLMNGDVQFISKKDESFGILQTTHCCFLCITAVQNAELSPDMAQKKGYCLSCIECLQSPYTNIPTRDIVYFCTSFFLKTCLKVSGFALNCDFH